MSLLRWILLLAGVVLLAGIYIWDRRNRRTQPSDRFSAHAAHSLDQQEQKQGHGHRANGGAHVPELADTLVVHNRVIERPHTITARDIAFNTDDLPPMHADSAPESVSPSCTDTPMDVAAPEGTPRDAHLSSVSTGSFIAMQAQRNTLLQSNEIVGEPIGVASTAPEVATSQPLHVDVGAVTRPTPKKPPSSRKIVALRLSAGSDKVEGSRLKLLLESAGLRHGKYSIYHRLAANDAPLFSVASMVEPGTFDPFAMSGVQFPGVTLFTQLPGPIAGGEMLAQMLACARELEQGIGGLLQDERGLPLTEQREQRLRDDVENFVHLLGQS